MNFDLSDDQRLTEETLDRMMAKEYDLGWVRQVFESPSGQDDGFWERLADMGLFGIMVPESYGGSGLGLVDTVVVAETLGYHAAPGPFMDQVLAIVAIARWGTEEQKQGWLPGLVQGRLRATVALGEPDGRWMPSEWSTGTGGSVGTERLNGRKIGVLYPRGADLLVVGTAEGLYVVDASVLGDATAESMAIDGAEPLDRTRRTAAVDFRDTPAEPLPFGRPGELIDIGLILLAADASGGSRRCLDMTTDYVKSREQFGVTIGSFQGVKHQLADMAVDVLPNRYLVWYAAHCFDTSSPDTSKAAAMAKARTSEKFESASRKSVELHGGIGYTWECDVQFFVKRAILDRVLLGSPSVQYRRVAAINGW